MRMSIELDAVQVLVLSVVVLWAGATVTSALPLLRRFNIPIAVTGGLGCSLAVAALGVAEVAVEYDLSLRDELLLVFFSTIGLSAKFRLLKEGGLLLAYMGMATLLFLSLQNGLGVALASSLGAHWAYGLIGGSVSLAGGHGTAITWGELAEGGGLAGAMDLGLTFATFGLIAGGVIGGPIARYLIGRDRLSPGVAAPTVEPDAGEQPDPAHLPVSVTSREVIRTIFLLGICIGAGSTLNDALDERGVVLPGFLTAMGVGILLTNVADLRKQPVDPDTVRLFNEVSLHLFLAMSLMSMQLLELADALGPIALVLGAQVVLTAAFAILVIYRVCGKTYDAAVMAAGYAGLGLGATPVGVANMNAITSRFGPSPAAFLVVPLVGAFLLDIVNAFVIQTYIQLLGGS